jgi:4-hydroxybutyryl-CoA dehydratase / vinylacetyl-CoA-Delta-isomerase
VAFTYSYATHYRHTCIAARAGFGDLLIGAGALMTEANGLDLDMTPNLREAMVELIKIVEGFYACGVAASVYGKPDPCGVIVPDPVFANVGKLLLATQIYDMHRIAHHVSGRLVVALPGPEEDHNPETGAKLSEVLSARPGIRYDKRMEVARFIEDLTASYSGGWYSLISPYQPTWGRLSGSDENGDLPQLSHWQQSRSRRTATRARCAWCRGA